jgi:hypothetical protein
VTPKRGAGVVVLELGASIGALILYAPAGLDGQEIEISRAGVSRRTHSVVRRRETGTHAAVYPDLPAGDYAIWRPDGEQILTTTIAGGRVTSCRWPD